MPFAAVRTFFLPFLALLFAITLPGCGTEQSSAEKQTSSSKSDALKHLVQSVGEPQLGDLDAMKQRGVLRALVIYSRTDFFLDQGRIRGIQHDFLSEFEKQLNAGVKKAQDKVHVQFVPVTFDQLIPALEAGLGDIAAAFLTVTPERQARVDFVTSGRLQVDEIVVSHADAGELGSLDDLAGRQVYVLRGSSYAEHLIDRNTDLIQRGLAPIEIVEGDSHLLSEDILELVNAGIVPITVVDSYRAELWAKVMPNLRLHRDLAVTSGNQIGWAIRKNSPQLQAALEQLINKKGKGSLVGNMLFGEYFAKVKWIKNPQPNNDKLLQYLPLFRKYSEQYGHEPLALAAQAYQESGLNPKAKSGAGAVGLMQLLPSTAADPNVGIPDISNTEANIHAGAKYMAFLRDRYFADAELKSEDRRAFTLASYNAGPAAVRRMRAKASELGLDPNVWSNNVEVAAGILVGREPVNYVTNIQKYLLAYTLAERLHLAKATAGE